MGKRADVGFSELGTEIAELLALYHGLCETVVVGTMVTIIFFLVGFRTSEFWDKSIKKHETLEFWWCFIPLVWVIVLSYPSMYNLYKMDCGVKHADATVKITGHQWYWSYEHSVSPKGGYMDNEEMMDSQMRDMFYSRWGLLRYVWVEPEAVAWWIVGRGVKSFSFVYDSFMVPTGDLSNGDFRLMEVDHRLVLPKAPCLLSVTSDDVIHSWSVPSLGVKIDAVPGKHNLVTVVPKRYGLFYGQCAELCGVNHSYMPIVVEVVPFCVYDEWANKMFNCNIPWENPNRNPHWVVTYVNWKCIAGNPYSKAFRYGRESGFKKSWDYSKSTVYEERASLAKRLWS